MKNKTLLSLTLITLLGSSTLAHAGGNGYGAVLWNSAIPKHSYKGCEANKTAPCTDFQFWPITFWGDPGMVAATALDLAATKKQQKKSVNAENALKQLESSLGKGCSGSDSDAKETSLSGQNAALIAPDIVLEQSQDQSFASTRKAVEDYLFYSEDCKDDCILERQNTWLLTSVEVAAATGDKLLAVSKIPDPAAEGEESGKTLTSEFETLRDNFNKQISPMGVWGASSQITLHTHTQQNDINALYARDLEMTALNAVHESENTKKIEN